MLGKKQTFYLNIKLLEYISPTVPRPFFRIFLSLCLFFFLFTLSLSHDKSFTMHVFKKQKCLAACVFSLFSLASACGMIYILLYTYIYIYTFHIFCLIKNANFTEKKR